MFKLLVVVHKYKHGMTSQVLEFNTSSEAIAAELNIRENNNGNFSPSSYEVTRLW